MKYDLSEFESDDFGFTTTDKIVEEVKVKDAAAMKQLEKLILPLLLNLKKNPDNAYIHWPDREKQIESQIEKILKITRG